MIFTKKCFQTSQRKTNLTQEKPIQEKTRQEKPIQDSQDNKKKLISVYNVQYINKK